MHYQQCFYKLAPHARTIENILLASDNPTNDKLCEQVISKVYSRSCGNAVPICRNVTDNAFGELRFKMHQLKRFYKLAPHTRTIETILLVLVTQLMISYVNKLSVKYILDRASMQHQFVETLLIMHLEATL